MKKMLSLLLGFTMLFLLAGCNGSNQQTNSTGVTTVENKNEVKIEVNNTPVYFFVTENVVGKTIESINNFNQIPSEHVMHVDSSDKVKIDFGNHVPSTLSLVRYYMVNEKLKVEEDIQINDGKAEFLWWTDSFKSFTGLHSSPGNVNIGLKAVCTFDDGVKAYYFMVKYDVVTGKPITTSP